MKVLTSQFSSTPIPSPTGICQFGLAHVDTPKGDLDASSGALTGPDKTVVYNDAVYPSGTTEQFPSMYDTDGNVVPNTAHEYRECSNKGICDRSSGSCQCFAGYEGSACQRASCPVTNGLTCSGHGKCKDIKTLAQDEDNVYNLWDEYSTLGCQCDAGFTGADCSQKQCKKGADPLYYDDFANVRFANWTVQFYTQSATEYVYGNYSFIFTDSNGEDWQTDPIDINANCKAVTTAFESLPNNVVPEGTVLCFKSELPLHNKQAYANDGSTSDTNLGQAGSGIDAIYDANFYIVTRLTLAFPANPGKLAPLRVNSYLDGSRPTLYTKAYPSTLGWHIYPNGYTGEDTDYVNDECVGVLASVNVGTTTHYLGSMTPAEVALLKACLGDSNGVSGDNVDTYNWDYGNWMNPHLIKLIEATGDRVTQYLRPDGTSYTIADEFSAKGEGVEAANGDSQTYDYPITRLCNNGKVWVTRKNNVYLPVSTSEVGSSSMIGESAINSLLTDSSNYYNIGQQGYCVNVQPPGFYAVIYFDDCTNQPTMNSRGYDAATNPTNTFCSAASPFRILTRAGADYGSNTLFHIYTTKGWLQLVNENVGAYTTDAAWTVTATQKAQKVASYHSKSVHFTNVTENYKIAGTTVQTFWGQLDCETTTLGQQGALDCIDKDSMVMFLSLGIKDPKNDGTAGGENGNTHPTTGLANLDSLYNTVANPSLLEAYTLTGSNQVTLTQGKCFEGVTSRGVTYGPKNVASGGSSARILCPDSGAYLPTTGSLGANPKYPNIYTVRSIGRNPKDYALLNGGDAGRIDPAESWFPDSVALDENFRNTAILDYALNANYPKTNIYVAQQALAASAITPASVYKFYPPPAGGYNYVGECSNRGLCNTGTGVCSCFAGYTGDSCGEVNALAV